MTNPSATTWARRYIDARGSHFRIESGSPLIGKDGPETVKIYAINDNEEVFLITHGHGTGLARIDCDKSIQIRAGDSNDPNNIDIRISAATGDININADRGRLRLGAQNISITAEQDVDIEAKRNLNLKSSSGRVFMKGNTLQCVGKRGNLVPESWGSKVCRNSFIPKETIAATFDPKSQAVTQGGAPGSFDHVGEALKGQGVSLDQIPGVTARSGGTKAVEKAVEVAKLNEINPLQRLSNFAGDLSIDTPVKDVLGKLGAGDLLDKVTALGDDPISAAMGLSGLPANIPGSTTISGLANNVLAKKPIGSAMDVVKGIGGKVLTGNISNLTSGAMSALGVAKGGSALTGLNDIIGTGSVAKGVQSTVSNMTSDALASLPVKKPIQLLEKLDTQQIEDLSNSTAMYMKKLEANILQAANTPNALKKIDKALGTDIKQTLLQGETLLDDAEKSLEKFANNFKLT